EDAALTRREQSVDVAVGLLSNVLRDWVVRVHEAVHLGRQPRQGPEPGELFILQQEWEEIGGRGGAVTALVDAALAVQQQLVQRQQSETDLTQAIAIQVHASLYTVPEAVARAKLPLQAVEDLERELVATERRHEVGALDAVAHREEHLAGDLDPFLARGLAARG